MWCIASDTSPGGWVVSDAMPRPGPPRPQLAVRVALAAVTYIDGKDAELATSGSELVRRMLSYGARTTTWRDWKP